MSEEPEDYSDIVGKPPAVKRMGRPPMPFTEEIADKICELLAEPLSLRKICDMEGMPSKTTVLKWLDQHPEFARQYARAREAQADAMIDDTLDIADNKSLDPQDRRVRIDTRKWLAGKLRPKKYGEKILLGEDADNPLQKPEATIDVFKLAEQLREAKRLSAVEPIELKALPKGDK
jgi:hypothetical protein